MLDFRFLLIAFCSHLGWAQQFEDSNNFKVTATRSLCTEEIMVLEHGNRPAINCYVFDLKNPTKKLIEIKPDEYELFDTVLVSELRHPGLKNIERVLRVETVYSACCSWSDISFYLISKTGTWIQLPDLHQATCDWPAEINEYYFPSQHQKSQKQIQNVMLSINNEGEIDAIKTNSVLLWNGKNYSVPNE